VIIPVRNTYLIFNAQSCGALMAETIKSAWIVISMKDDWKRIFRFEKQFDRSFDTAFRRGLNRRSLSPNKSRQNCSPGSCSLLPSDRAFSLVA
jgi:hypothetical protein